MIIDSPIISGSSAASGSFSQVGIVAITGSLFVNGIAVTGNTGSAESASFAGAYTLTSSFQSYTSSADARIASINDNTASLNNYTASTDAKIASVNAFSASILNYTSSTDAKLTALYAFSSSLLSYTSSTDAKITSLNAATASLNSYTSSTDAKITSVYNATSSLQSATASLQSATASLDASIASLNSYTSSNAMNIASLFATSASLNANVAGLNTQTASLNASVASLNSYTSSNTMNVVTLFAASASLNASVASLNSQTASLLNYTSSNNTTNNTQNTRLSALEAATASLYTTTSSLNASVAGLNTYTSSLNARTASFATTGSNTFTGRQYISDTSQATSFTATSSLYTDGGLRVTRDAYVSGTLFLNNLTVFGTQSVAFISSSQLNIATNIISVNTSTPSVRFGGLAVQDSGSGATGLTGSILWDSQDNQWIYSNPSGSTYDSAVFLVGPRSSGALGNEVGITTNALAKGDGLHHMTSSVVFDVSGSVGIGTSSPARTLEVYGNGNDGTQVQIKGTLDSAGIKLIPSSGDNWEIQATNSSQFVVYNRTDSAHRLLIDSVGNVGIGTTTASAKLTVSHGGDAAYLTLNTTSSANKRSRIQFTQNNNSGLEIGTDYNVDNTANFYFYNRDLGGVAALVLTPGSNHYFPTGNVGIGTTDPANKLSVAGNISSTSGNLHTNRGRVAFSSTAGDANHSIYNNYNNIDGEGIWDGMKFNVYAGASFRVGDAASATPTTALYINSSGNVGIGTTNPGFPLVVSRGGGSVDTIVMNGDVGYNVGLGIYKGGTQKWAVYASSSDTFHIFSTGLSTNVVSILSGSGNVGIGSTSPGFRLDVSGSINSNNRLFVGDTLYSRTNNNIQAGAIAIGDTSLNYGSGSGWTSNTAGLLLECLNNTEIAIHDADARIASFMHYGSNLFTIGRDMGWGVTNTNFVGNVGIGSTSPSYTLDVAGTGRFTGNIITTGATAEIMANGAGSSNTVGGSSRFTILDSSNTRGWILQQNASYNLSFWHFNSSWSNVINFTPAGAATFSSTIAATSATFSGRLSATGTDFHSLIVAEGSAQLKLERTNSSTGLMYIGADNVGFKVFDSAFATRLTLTSGGNLGIGTTSPATKLTVYVGSGTISGTNDAIRLQVASYANAARNTIVWHQDGGDTILARYGLEWNSSTTNMNFVWRDVYANNATGSTELMRLQGNGNLGIGTTSPLSKLHVAGDARTVLTSLAGGDTLISAIAGVSNGYRILVDTSNNITYSWSTGTNTTAMTILNSSNVGIGTTSPIATLEVASSVRLAKLGAGIVFTSTNTAQAWMGSENWGWTGAAWSRTSSSAGVIWGTGNNNGAFEVWTALSSDAASTAPTNSNSRFFFANSGNVGIGTTSPTVQLSVSPGVSSATLRVGSWAVMENVTTDQAMFGRNVVYATSIGSGWRNINTAGATAIRMYDDPGDASIAFHLHGSETGGTSLTSWDTTDVKMTIRNGGNVGIGTTSPAARLDILGPDGSVGTIRWKNDGGRKAGFLYSDSAGIGIYDTNFNDAGIYLAGNTQIDFRVNGSQRMLINSSGNVGISTTSPADKLEIYEGNIRLHKNHIIDNSATWLANINFTDEVDRLGARITGERTAWDGAPMGLGFDTGGVGTVTRRMTITSGGSIGIGTTSPSSRLHISGSGGRLVRIEGPSNQDNYLSIFSGGIEMFLDADTTNSAGIVGTQSGHNLILRTNGDNRVWINTSGNVGIGTSSPSAKLQVSKDGGNGAGGLGDFNIVATSTSAAGAYQATIGAMNIEAGGYANLNLGDSDGASGTRYFWHISKRLSNADELGSGGRNLSYYWYNGSGFTIKFAFGTNGSFYAAADVVAYASSDIRLKDNVVKIESPLEKLMKLNGYSFTWNDKQTTYEAGKKDLGVIAQEVEQVFPEIVKDRENGTKGVMYDKLVPVLIEAIKEQQQQIDELKYLLQTINK